MSSLRNELLLASRVSEAFQTTNMARLNGVQLQGWPKIELRKIRNTLAHALKERMPQLLDKQIEVLVDLEFPWNLSRHESAEAYCLMWYECQDCGKRERLWNSRDGVTPFGIGCDACPPVERDSPPFPKGMHHVEWEKDEYVPDHKPKKGDRIFVDLTVEKSREYAQRMLDEHWDEFKIEGRSKEEQLEMMVDDFEEGQPDILVVGEGMEICECAGRIRTVEVIPGGHKCPRCGGFVGRTE